MIRPFEWQDLPRLHRYRKRGLWLDNEIALTQWQLFVPIGALVAYLGPATGVFTYVARKDGQRMIPVIGQAYHVLGSTIARLTFIAPKTLLHSGLGMTLLDQLAEQSGKRGAQNLLADVDESSPAFEVLRKAGYAIFARQRVWQVNETPKTPASPFPWRTANNQDEIAIRTLYNALVPALVQQTEPPPWGQLNGFVYWQGDQLLAYIHLNAGPRGILAHPFIHPDLEEASKALYAVFQRVASQNNRPVYMTVRSYQGWLEGPLEELNAQPGPRQAVMVKRLAVLKKAELPLKLPVPGLDNAQPEVTASSMINTEVQ